MPCLLERNEQITGRTGQHQRDRFGLVINALSGYILINNTYILYHLWLCAALPQISLRPGQDPISVVAGETTQIDCSVAEARPAPAINWMLGKKLYNILLINK